MFKKSFLISVLVMGITLVWISESISATCSRCRFSPWAICYEEILEKIKETNKVTMAGLAKIEVIKLSLGRWCNPAGVCFDPSSGDPQEFYAPFGIIGLDLLEIDPLDRSRVIYDRKYWPECELWDLYFCADADNSGSPDLEERCYKYDESGACEQFVQVCTSYYDYSKLPLEAYWDEGQVDKWTPEQLSCNPEIFPLGNPEALGSFFVELMWVESYKVVITLNKDGTTTTEEVPLDAVCMELELVEDGDRINYNIVNESVCYPPIN